MSRLRQRMNGDAGFTLVELLIASAITVILISAIGAALLISIKTYTPTQDRFAASHDAQLVSSYLTSDLGSSSTSSYTVSPTSTWTQTAHNVLAISWKDASTGNTVSATYSVVQSSGTWTLVRTYSGPNATGTTVSTSHTLVHNLSATSGATATNNATTGVTTMTVNIALDNESYSFTVSGGKRT